MTNRTDNFTRSDSSTSLGTPSDGGSAWVAQKGTWGISSDQGYVAASSGNQDSAVLQASVADVTVQVTLAAVNGIIPGPIARAADSTDFLLWIWRAGSDVLQMYKLVGGSYTQLGSNVSYLAANGDIISFSCVGSTLNGYVNGTLKLGPITDSTGSTNTLHGISDFDSSGARFTAFSITGSSPPPTASGSTLAMMGCG